MLVDKHNNAINKNAAGVRRLDVAVIVIIIGGVCVHANLCLSEKERCIS
jgi:hypothetical protein